MTEEEKKAKEQAEARKKVLEQLQKMRRHALASQRNATHEEARIKRLMERPRKHYWTKMRNRGINTDKFERLTRRGQNAMGARLQAEHLLKQIEENLKQFQEAA